MGRKALHGQVLLFTLIRVVLNTNTRMVYPFLNVFARGLGVDLSTLSLALTARSLTGAVSPLLSPLADRYGRRFNMLLGLGIFSGAAALVVFWPSYPVFFAAAILTFLGMFIYLPAMQAYLGDAFPYAERGRAIAITELGWSASFALGMPLVGVLIARYGWQAPFPLLAGLGLVGVVLLYRLVPPLRLPQSAAQGAWSNLRRVLSYPPALAGLAMSLAFVSANELVNLVFGVWMEDSFGLKIAALGAASAVIGVSEFVAESLTAGFVDRIGKERAVMIGLLGNALVSAALPFLGRSLVGGLIGLFGFYLTFEFAIVSSLPLMTEVMPSARATLMGLNVACFSLGRALGALVGPRIYALGFVTNAVAAVVLDLLALAALSRVRTGEAAGSAPAEGSG